MIKFHCSNCGQKIAVPDNSVGKKAKCPKCGTACPVPYVQTQNPKPVIKFFCVQCDQKVHMPQEYSGRKCKCPKCQAINTVPYQPAYKTANNIGLNNIPSEHYQEEQPLSSPDFNRFLIALSVFALILTIGFFAYVTSKTATRQKEVKERQFRAVVEQRTDAFVSQYGYNTQKLKELIAKASDRNEKRILSSVLLEINYEKEKEMRQKAEAERQRQLELARIERQRQIELAQIEEQRQKIAEEKRQNEIRWLNMTPLEKLLDFVSHIESFENNNKTFKPNMFQYPSILSPLNIEETSNAFFKRLAQTDIAKRRTFAEANPKVKIKFQSLMAPSYKGTANRSFLQAAMNNGNLGWKLSSQKEYFFYVNPGSLERAKKRAKKWRINQVNKELHFKARLYASPLTSRDEYTCSQQFFSVKFNFGTIEDSDQILFCDHLRDKFILVSWELDLIDISFTFRDNDNQYSRELHESYEFNADVYE